MLSREVHHMPCLVVIEDNPGDLRLIREAVARADGSVDVIAFEDGPQALAALCGEEAMIHPGVVLLDLRLQTSDGLDVLRRLRFTPRLADIPVIVFTSSSASVDKQRSHLLGATSFIPKPRNIEDYFRVIGDVVQNMVHPPQIGGSGSQTNL